MLTRQNQIQNFIMAQHFDEFIKSQDGGWKTFMENDSLELPDGFEPLAQYSSYSARDLRGAMEASLNEFKRFLDDLLPNIDNDDSIHKDFEISDPSSCPECGSSDDFIEWGPEGSEGCFIYRVHKCKNCSSQFEERYDLANIRRKV